MTVLLAHLAVVLTVVDERPKDEDVVAGWTGFAVFVLLIAAVAFLGFSLTKHLRRAQAAEEAGLYGSDEPAERSQAAQVSAEKPHQAP